MELTRQLVLGLALLFFIASQLFFELRFVDDITARDSSEKTQPNDAYSPSWSFLELASSSKQYAVAGEANEAEPSSNTIVASITNSKPSIMHPSRRSASLDKFEMDLQRLHATNKKTQPTTDDEMGKLCFIGSMSDLDEVLRVFIRLYHLGRHLQRIVVIPPYLLSLYDPFLMESSVSTGGTRSVRISKNQGFCDPRNNTPNVTMWHHQHPVLQKWPEILKEKNDTILYIGGKDLEAHAPTLFDNIAPEELAVMRQVYSSLFPYKETRETIQDFIAQHFGDQPFVAVHLDFCDPNVQGKLNSNFDSAFVLGWFGIQSGGVEDGDKVGGSWCAQTDLSVLRWVLEQNAAHLLNAPIFLSTSQKFGAEYPEIIQQYLNAEENYAVMFEGECPRRYECDMINREIVSNSAYFYSCRETHRVMSMDKLRMWRRNADAMVRPPALFRNFALKDLRNAFRVQGRTPNVLPVMTIAAKENINEKEEVPQALSHYQLYLVELNEAITLAKKKKPSEPHAVKGVICQLGLFEQLNNVLDQTAGLLHLGNIFRRTVVVPPLVSELYSFSTLETHWKFRDYASRKNKFKRLYPIKRKNKRSVSGPRISHDLSLCDPKRGWGYASSRSDEGLDGFVDRYSRFRAPVLVIGAKDAFHFGFETRKMFEYLHAHQETREIAVNFVEQHFGDQPFVAVHLRFLDGTCYEKAPGNPACDLDPVLLRQILKLNAPELMDAPIFVASDRERPDLELLFAKAGAVSYRGKCHSYDKQCMVIDAEIAARSAYFYGLYTSTAAQNIERLRRQRNNGTPFKQLDGLLRLDKNATTTLFGGPDIWQPHRWEIGLTPEKWLASQSKENLNLVTGVLAPQI